MTSNGNSLPAGLSAVAYRKHLSSLQADTLTNGNHSNPPVTSPNSNDIPRPVISVEPVVVEESPVVADKEKGKEKEQIVEVETTVVEEEDIIMKDLIVDVESNAIPSTSTSNTTSNILDHLIDPLLLAQPLNPAQPQAELEPKIINQKKVSKPLFTTSVSDIEVDELDAEVSGLSNLEERPIASSSTSIAKPKKSTASSSTSTPVRSTNTPNAANPSVLSFTSIPLPHYTIKRVKNNSKENPHVISVNAGVTDANPSRWPTVTSKNSGVPNWHDSGPATLTRSIGWREGLGRELAERLGEKKTTVGGKPEFFILEDFPEHNKFFVHHSSGKGSTQDRLDSYLFGSPFAPKFRTVNEYAPHLYWLLTTGPDTPYSCQCKYCTGKKQGDVNKLLGLGGETKRESMSPTTERVAKKARVSATPILKEKRIPSPPVASTSRPKSRASEPTRPKAPTYNGAYSDPTRELDLNQGALHRTSEMVWIILPVAYVDPKGEQPESITHWPAIIMERKIVTVSKRVGELEEGKAPQISNEKHFEYVVRLLACTDSYTLPETSLITWLAHPQPMDLWSNQALLTATESVKLVWNGKECLRPTLEATRSVFEVMAPFALAMQIAAHVVSSFCLVDRYHLKPAHIISPPGLSEEEEKAARDHLGYSHFQSLWNGTERIYSGEVVRLLAGLSDLPKGNVSLFPGAETRSFFIQMKGIYKNPEKNMAMCCGPIYQLQDLSQETTVEGGMKMFETGGEASRSNGTVITSNSSIKEGKQPEKLPGLLATPLSIPPPGFAFRKLITNDVEIHFGIECIAGRYHQLPIALANAPQHVAEIMKREQQKDIKRKEEDSEEEYSTEVRALILSGLLPANKLYMKAHSWSASRTIAVTQAESTAQSEMSSFLEERQVNVELA